MHQPAPPQLVALLERLGLATPGQVQRVEGRVRRLGRELPGFESVWVDALAQARLLTPFQAARLNAGQGDSLRVGPYLLCQPIQGCHYAACYRARRIPSGEAVRLVVVESATGRPDQANLQRMSGLAAKLPADHLAPITQLESDGRRVWAASPWIEGRTAAEWMVHHGRFPPDAVLEIARQMLAGLLALESTGLCHGDIGTASLLLSAEGAILLEPGLRGIVRPAEGFAYADLQPAAYDGLAPERITEGTPPNAASDAYACGCLWWHLLCGRPPIAGGDSLTKLRAAQLASIAEVRRLAPETPEVLAAAISACVHRDPKLRPRSMAALAAMLGSSTRRGKQALVRCLGQPSRLLTRWAVPASRRTSNRAARWSLAAAMTFMAALAVFWPLWRSGWLHRKPVASTAVAAGDAKRDVGRVDGGRETSANATARAAGARRKTVSDEKVLPAGYDVPPQLPSAGSPRPLTGGDLVLSADRPFPAEKLELKPRQCVRGAAGKRLTMLVPPAGLVITADGVRFEGIDFLWDHPTVTNAPGAAALLQIRAAQAEFHGCTFQSTRTAGSPPQAIVWVHPPDRAAATFSLPSGRLQLHNCWFRRVGAAIACHTLGARAVELTNVLHTGSGPLVWLDHCPAADEPWLLSLARVTLRGSGPLVDCDFERIEAQPGEIGVQAAGCVFVPGPGAPLLLLSGPHPPERLLKGIKWTGQGSLVSPETAIAAWRRPEAAPQSLDDSQISMAGLVRSAVEFAAGPVGGRTAHRALRWQAPLQSSDSPGVDVDLLPGEQSP